MKDYAPEDPISMLQHKHRLRLHRNEVSSSITKEVGLNPKVIQVDPGHALLRIPVATAVIEAILGKGVVENGKDWVVYRDKDPFRQMILRMLLR